VAVPASSELVRGAIEVPREQHRLQELEAELRIEAGALHLARWQRLNLVPKTLDEQSDSLERHETRIAELLWAWVFRASSS
jgi:hypothetical protein